VMRYSPASPCCSWRTLEISTKIAGIMQQLQTTEQELLRLEAQAAIELEWRRRDVDSDHRPPANCRAPTCRRRRTPAAPRPATDASPPLPLPPHSLSKCRQQPSHCCRPVEIPPVRFCSSTDENRLSGTAPSHTHATPTGHATRSGGGSRHTQHPDSRCTAEPRCTAPHGSDTSPATAAGHA
jgi:hypothetical protein